jgi:hypothetical protein
MEVTEGILLASARVTSVYYPWAFFSNPLQKCFLNALALRFVLRQPTDPGRFDLSGSATSGTTTLNGTVPCPLGRSQRPVVLLP